MGADSGDLDSSAAARTSEHTQLAIIDAHVAGFTDLDDHGYINMFVDPDLGRGMTTPAHRKKSGRPSRPIKPGQFVVESFFASETTRARFRHVNCDWRWEGQVVWNAP